MSKTNAMRLIGGSILPPSPVLTYSLRPQASSLTRSMSHPGSTDLLALPRAQELVAGSRRAR